MSSGATFLILLCTVSSIKALISQSLSILNRFWRAENFKQPKIINPLKLFKAWVLKSGVREPL